MEIILFTFIGAGVTAMLQRTDTHILVNKENTLTVFALWPYFLGIEIIIRLTHLQPPEYDEHWLWLDLKVGKRQKWVVPEEW